MLQGIPKEIPIDKIVLREAPEATAARETTADPEAMTTLEAPSKGDDEQRQSELLHQKTRKMISRHQRKRMGTFLSEGQDLVHGGRPNPTGSRSGQSSPEVEVPEVKALRH